VLIEVIFFYAYDPLSDWLMSNYGSDEQTWRIVILVANILILLEPCRRLSKIMRFTMYLVNKGKKQIGVPQDKVAAYESFSSLAFGSAITLIIVILVPNGIDSLLHVAILLALFIVIAILQSLKFRRASKKSKAPSEENAGGDSEI
jgi:cytochrome c biogenesis protein CcdA